MLFSPPLNAINSNSSALPTADVDHGTSSSSRCPNWVGSRRPTKAASSVSSQLQRGQHSTAAHIEAHHNGQRDARARPRDGYEIFDLTAAKTCPVTLTSAK